MPLKRKRSDGVEIDFKAIGHTVTPTEQLRDKWFAIQSPPSMTEEESQILLMVDERLSSSRNRRLARIDVMNASYLQYRAVNYYTTLYGGFPSYWNSWGANAFIPRTFEVVEGARSQLKSKIPDWRVEATEQKYAKFADTVGELSHSEWKRSHSQGQAVEALDDAIMWGRGIVYNQLINDVRPEHTIGFDNNGNLKYDLEMVSKYYGVGSTRIHPYDFFPEVNPDAYQVNSSPGANNGLTYTFVREIMDVEKLRVQLKKQYEDKVYGVTDKFQYLKPGGDLTDYKYLLTYIDDLYKIRSDVRYPATVSDLAGVTTLKGQSGDRGYVEGKIEVWHYWEHDRYIMLAMGMILRDTPNPYPHKQLPFSGMKLIETKTFDSMGYPEIMRWLQIVENTLYDQGLNNIVMNVHKMFAVKEGFLEDVGDLVVRPFGLVRIKNIPNLKISEAIHPIEFTPLHQDYFNFLSLSKSNISTVTGTSEFSTGGVTKEAKVERATVANRIAQGGILRVNEIARHFEQELISDAIEQQIKIMQLYYRTNLGGAGGLDVELRSGAEVSYARYVPFEKKEMTDEQITEAMTAITTEGAYKSVITQDDIQGSFRVVVRGGSSIMLDPDDEQRLKLEFMQFVATLMNPEPMTDAQGNAIPVPMYDMKKLSVDVGEEAFKIPNVERYLYKPKEEMAMGRSPADLEEEEPIIAPGGAALPV